MVPFAQFADDLANHALPDYSYLGLNKYDNAHTCPADNPTCSDTERLMAADNWLQTNLPPLLDSPDFNTPGGGLLIITFDEGVDTDVANGGGNVAWVVIGPDVRNGHFSTNFYQHPSTLRLMLEAIGLTSFPGAAATAPNMGEFLTAQ